MGINIMNKFFKQLDYFGVQFNFSYKSRDKYRTAIGGIFFLLFLAIAVSYSIINLIPLIKRDKMSVIYYSMGMSHTDEINFKNYSSNFGVGVSSCIRLNNLGEFWEIFRIEVNHVKVITEKGESSTIKEPIPIGKCEYSDFNNEFNSSFDSLGLDKYYCLKNTDYIIKGTVSDPVFQYIEVALKSVDTSAETFKKIEKGLFDECDFNMYVVDTAFDLSNFSNPIQRFLVSQYMNIKSFNLMKRNSYFQVQKFNSYENYLFDTRKSTDIVGAGSIDLYSVYKGNDRFTNGIADSDTFAKIFVRAELERKIIERRYMKLTEFAANISSILSAVLVFMFAILNSVNKFYANEAVIRQIFQFSHFRDKKGRIIKSNVIDMISKASIFGDTEFDTVNRKHSNNGFFEARENSGLILTSKLSEKSLGQSVKSTCVDKFVNRKKISFEKICTNTYFNARGFNKIKIKKKGSNLFRNKNNIQVQGTLPLKFNQPQQAKPNPTKKTSFHYNLLELFVVLICPKCSWSHLKVKTFLLEKARAKLYFQLDVLNYLKKVQSLELLNYILLEPYENTILQFLSKPSISLAQRGDAHDAIHSVNNVFSDEVNNLYHAFKELSETKDETPLKRRLYYLTKNEMNAWIKKLKYL